MKILALAPVILLCACASPRREALRETTRPAYDTTTGRLKELTFDYDKDGRIDTWTEMDGTRPVLTRMDTNGDGRVDRWEYYDDKAQLSKIGFSRKDNGQPDAWGYSGPDGHLQRIDVSSTGDEGKIDRREHYDGSGLIAAEEDTNGDGLVDRWETYKGGALQTAEFDENHDGTRDRRFTYEGGILTLIESSPDAHGAYRKRVTVEK